MALLWAVVASTYEADIGDDYAVVSHTFFGRTQAEAVGYFQAHMGTDSFLRGCTEGGHFKSIECRTEVAVLRYDSVTRQYFATQ
jgi:hypothetical protein